MITSKRGLAFALLAYFSTFVAAVISSLVLGYDPSQLTAAVPVDYCIAIIVSSTIASAVFTYLYFTHKVPQIKANTKEGFKFGITLIVIGFILDMIFFLPVVISSGNLQEFSAYYGKAYVYFVFAGALAASVGVGYWLEKNPKK